MKQKAKKIILYHNLKLIRVNEATKAKPDHISYISYIPTDLHGDDDEIKRKTKQIWTYPKKKIVLCPTWSHGQMIPPENIKR